MIIKSISPTKLQAYADCPRCFLLSLQKGKFVQTPAIIWGSRMHKALEQYHKLGYDTTDEDLQPYLDEYMKLNSQDFDVCEQFWKVPLLDTDIMLNLKVDLVKDNILIDHKTVSSLPTQEKIDQQKQLSAYSWAWRQMYDEPEDKIQFNYFLTNPKPGQELMHILSTSRNEDSLKEWEEWTYKILNGIAMDEFEPSEWAPWHNFEDCPLYVER